MSWLSEPFDLLWDLRYIIAVIIIIIIILRVESVAYDISRTTMFNNAWLFTYLHVLAPDSLLFEANNL